MGLLTALRRRLMADLDSRLAPRFHEAFAADPVTIYDVGAAGGIVTPYPDGPAAWAPVIGFEPHPVSYQRLVDAGLPDHVTLHNLALADRDGPVTFYAGAEAQRTKSSLRPIDYIGGDNEAITIEGLTLDSAPERLGIRPANFIKLDTEGTEDMIMRGGEAMFADDVLGVHTEIAFWTEQSGGVSFSQIDSHLTTRGFVLFDLQINRSDIRVVGGRKDKVRSGDALYLRNFDHMWSPDRDPADLRMKLLKLMSLVIGWRYINYTVELADFGRAKGLIDEAEFAAIVAPLLKTSDLSDRIPNFPGRTGLALLFDSLSYAFYPKMKKGVPFSFNSLGNHWVVRNGKNNPSTVFLHCPVLEEGTVNLSKIVTIDESEQSPR
jgi:FkbM family methyltransferase